MQEKEIISRDVRDKILQVYAKIDPDGGSWNPSQSDRELQHRQFLMFNLGQAIRMIKTPLHDIHALDVGCGTGRSARLLIEFGVPPTNIFAVDIRQHAIDYAFKLNPAINYSIVNSFSDLQFLGTFNWIQQCTVFSSIPGRKARVGLAEAITDTLSSKGYVFWWDLLKANDWAGGDDLMPVDYFPHLQILWQEKVPLMQKPSHAIRLGPLRRFLGPLIDLMLTRTPSHLVSLLVKKE